MFLNRCRLLLKRIYNSISMFREDNLAAAQIAQIFGSELLKVQQNAQTDSGSMPDIVKINPKQFLMGEVQHSSNRKLEEQRIMQSLQREAEATCPLPPEPQHFSPRPNPPPSSQAPTSPSLVFDTLPVLEALPKTSVNANDVLERIALSLERIANVVDKVESKPKRKTVKRNKSKSIKTILLNETTL